PAERESRGNRRRHDRSIDLPSNAEIGRFPICLLISIACDTWRKPPKR
ncbi:MAG: hypothetical protein QOG73_1031, partial [Acetobacteraceae bacterium]|nr:hypothetical protein [Acetobacteraceae bacterium]